MAVDAAVNGGFDGAEDEYDDALYARFCLWKDHSGKSLAAIATKLARSTTAVSQYINRKYPGSVSELERDIRSLLRREEELDFVVTPRVFCNTHTSKLIYEVLQYCDRKRKMGAVVCPSGTGKTETVNEYKRQNRATILISLDVTTRSAGNVIRRISEKTGGVGRSHSISALLQSTIDRLKGSNRLLIVDEAHFMSWEALELIRKIHDCAQIGVVYAGQERLYDQMVGNDDNARLFDQIFSRIAIKRDHFPVKKADVQTLADGMCPGLDRDSSDYLFQRAKGKGRFRTMKDLLEVALDIRKESGRPMDVELLREADLFLMKG